MYIIKLLVPTCIYDSKTRKSLVYWKASELSMNCIVDDYYICQDNGPSSTVYHSKKSSFSSWVMTNGILFLDKRMSSCTLWKEALDLLTQDIDHTIYIYLPILNRWAHHYPLVLYSMDKNIPLSKPVTTEPVIQIDYTTMKSFLLQLIYFQNHPILHYIDAQSKDNLYFETSYVYPTIDIDHEIFQFLQFVYWWIELLWLEYNVMSTLKWIYLL